MCRSNEHCGDPFRNSPTNEDRISLLDPVTVSYCPSGWCSKQIEGIRGKFEDDDGTYVKVVQKILRICVYVHTNIMQICEILYSFLLQNLIP